MAKPVPRCSERRPIFDGRPITALQLLLRSHKIPLSVVANGVGASVSHISNVSSGRLQPNADLRRRIERLLGRKWCWLMKPATDILGKAYFPDDPA